MSITEAVATMKRAEEAIDQLMAQNDLMKLRNEELLNCLDSCLDVISPKQYPFLVATLEELLKKRRPKASASPRELEPLT